MEKVLLSKIVDGIAVFEIYRPPYNPLNQEVIDEMASFLQEIYANPDVRVLVIVGSGEKAFSAGADINQFVSRLGKKDISLSMNFHRTFELLTQLPIPVIAALKGHVLGGGLELTLSCDFRICDPDTKLGLPEVNLGIFPGAGGTQRLPRIVGKSKAMEMMMFGTSIDAEEAQRIGIINRIVPVGSVEEEAMNWAYRLKEQPRLSLNQIKKAVNRGTEMSIADAIRYEMELFAEMFTSEDTKEGVQAFLEKRKANFKEKVE
ncbi:enoyl-CoA hydratase-related protein [Neobacillus sp. YX16]|uniref:enoyl-CoA hydratase/isomerase family protein n=1 Tax=Neobacillus sp. YX16 TaxID=3047874 RepID=UPI0024C356EB|nr:enoyl-CoA hydratase-related protein [Neobacillus sp. YX16]WHZ05238.1 enoyl-CoA hydratase-related protein [Neobacillus sp. YX16]